MANEGNLNPPWQPGESGNPDGRPKGSKNLSTLLHEALQKIVKTTEGEEISTEIALVRRVIKKAVQDGDMRAIEMIWAYLEGKPKERKIVEFELPQNLIDLIRHGAKQPAQAGGSASVPATDKG